MPLSYSPDTYGDADFEDNYSLSARVAPEERPPPEPRLPTFSFARDSHLREVVLAAFEQELLAKLIEMRSELNRLTISVLVLKCSLAIQSVGSNPDDVTRFLEQIEQIEQACSPGLEAQKSLSVVIQALKNWTPKRSSDS